MAETVISGNEFLSDLPALPILAHVREETPQSSPPATPVPVDVGPTPEEGAKGAV